MAWVQIDDFTEARIEGTAHRLTVCIDSVEVRGYDVAAGNPDDLVAALGEHLSGIAAPLVVDEIHEHTRHWLDAQVWAEAVEPAPHSGPSASGEPNDQGEGDADHDEEHPGEAVAGSGELVTDEPEQGEHADTVANGDATRGRASDAVVRAWCTYWEIPCSKTGRLTQSAREAYERAGGGRPVDRPHEDGARQPATDGHPAPAIVALGDGSEARRAEAVDPAGVDEAPVASPPREPDALTRAEELLEQRWTPRQVADEVGLELEEVRDLYRQLHRGARR